MSCSLTTNIAIPCRDSGGIKRIFITDLVTAQASIVLASGTTGAIQSITGTTGWYTYDFRKQTGTFTETSKTSDTNGTSYYEPDVKIVLNNLSLILRNEMYNLSLMQLAVIVQTNNGDYWLIGYYNGLTQIAGTAGAGKAFGDQNGYTFDLQGAEPVPMIFVPASIMAPFAL